VTRPTISVAMCTFNGSRFLPAQLSSIATQHRLPDELVICDDGSSDDSLAILASFVLSAPFRVRIVRNEKRLGSTKNFQKAISLCHCEVVALADQDDVWYPQKLARVEEEFAANPVAVFSDADLIDSAGEHLHERLWNSYSFSLHDQHLFAADHALAILIKHPVVTGATLAFRRSLANVLLPIPAGHVHDFWISFLLAACGPVQLIPEPLLQYRRHEAQQIGPGQNRLRDRLAQARKTGPAHYQSEIAKFRLLRERLERRRAEFRHPEVACQEIDRKVAHLRHRAHLPRLASERIPEVLREILNGGYSRYSEGWQSIAKDLLAPVPDDAGRHLPKGAILH